MSIDTKRLFELKRELNELTQANPELAKLQKQIDIALDKIGDNKYNRMILLNELMFDSLRKMSEKFVQISNEIKKLVETEIKPEIKKDDSKSNPFHLV